MSVDPAGIPVVPNSPEVTGTGPVIPTPTTTSNIRPSQDHLTRLSVAEIATQIATLAGVYPTSRLGQAILERFARRVSEGQVPLDVVVAAAQGSGLTRFTRSQSTANEDSNPPTNFDRHA